MPWQGFDMYNNPMPVMMNDRVGRQGRGQHVYYTDGRGMLIPQAGPGVGRSNSLSAGTRPAQIVINNAQYDDLSPPHTSRSRRRSHGHRSPAYDDDDNWDDPAPSPRRYRSRNRSRSRSRNRSRDRSRDRRHSHSHHHYESRSPPAQWDLETQRKMQKLEELERKEEEEAARERAKQEMLLAEAKKAAEKKEEEEYKKRVLAEAEREKYENELKEKNKKEEEDRIFKARLKEMYLAQGYSEESIERMIQEAENKRRGSHGGHSPHSPPALTGHEGAMTHLNQQMNVSNSSKTTYLKVQRKHLSPDTLDLYGVPWEWDERDSNYIIIKTYIDQNVQDKLFEHTRRWREQRQQRLLPSAPVELQKDAHGKMKLVRDKSPAGGRSRSRPRSWMFT
ncbi:MAG: hypothetical protein LQ349_000910 [Xanthoria aureola]|nr:MAG: hypothetical protein LQ349_000910 [Xanthoria aureola]